MRRILAAMLLLGLIVGTLDRSALGEDLQQAWDIALRVNDLLQAQQAETMAAGLNLRAARADRLPTIRSITFDAFLTATPTVSTRSLFGSSGGASGFGPGASGLFSAFPSSFQVIGPGQRNLPFSLTFANLPLYTGGRLLRNIDAAGAQVGARRSDEFHTAQDLKLTVGEAYVGVLRARKNLEVARSDVEQLSSFAKDVRNRREQGLAIRSDELAAEVSLANAQLAEIQSRTALQSAWATYNRYLCRPLTEEVSLEELTVLPEATDLKAMADQAIRDGQGATLGNESEVEELTTQALRTRPELASLAEQARGLGAQSQATLAGIKPQVGFAMGFVYLGSNNLAPQGIGAATFYADWTITDCGATRRRAAAIQQQERAALRRRADTAADIALQVRTRWLDLQQVRRKVPVARLAVMQAEENTQVVTDRYRQQLSTYTEVLDAETRRIQSLNNLHNAIYDEDLAQLRLRRAVGDL
jgi:outer membrane protein TolC